MTHEEKDLLLKDLCARLPYGVRFPMKIWNDKEGKIVEKIAELDVYNKFGYAVGTVINGPVKKYVGEIVKPYLFPLSSMTEEQKYDFYCRFIENDCDFDDFKEFYLNNGMWHKMLTSLDDIDAIIDFFDKNHFDYRGLIPMGLAIDATGLNIY